MGALWWNLPESQIICILSPRLPCAQAFILGSFQNFQLSSLWLSSPITCNSSGIDVEPHLCRFWLCMLDTCLPTGGLSFTSSFSVVPEWGCSAAGFHFLVVPAYHAEVLFPQSVGHRNIIGGHWHKSRDRRQFQLDLVLKKSGPPAHNPEMIYGFSSGLHLLDSLELLPCLCHVELAKQSP